jgi:hypothetical protein
MPYDVVKRDDQYCVIKVDTKEVIGCHQTREQAIDQIQAIGASKHASEAQELSHGELHQLLSVMLRDRYPESVSPWIRAVYDDYLVYEVERAGRVELYRVSYAVVGDQVQLGEPERVEMHVEYVPVSEVGKPMLVEPVEVDLDGYEPDEGEIAALVRIVMELLKQTDGNATEALAQAAASQLGEAKGNIQSIISTFGRWAGGSHHQCVALLRGKSGISDPVRLCAWLKDRYLGTTSWRGKRSEAVVREASVPLTTLSDGVLIESADDGLGWRWRVQLIQAGVSKNRTEYPLEVLHRRASLYEGVPVFYSDGPDHDPNRRGFGAIAGWIVEARPNSRGVEGVLELNRGRPELRETFLQAWEVVQKTGKLPFGFSHVVPAGRYRLSVRRLAEGQVVRRIEDFDEVESVDIVMRPSAGGELLGLVAAIDEREERSVRTMAVLVERLRRGERLTEAELNELKAQLSPEEYLAALETGIAAREDAAKGVSDDRDVATEAQAIREAVERVRRLECRALLAERLAEAKASGLPAVFVERIRRDFADRVFEAEELEQRIAADRELAAKLAESQSLPRTGKVDATVVEDQRERWQKAMDGLFEGRVVDGVRPFTSLKQAYRVISGSSLEYIDPNLSRMILGEAAGWVPPGHPLAESITTTTFAQILGDSMTRRMIQEYSRPNLQTWRAIVGPNIVPLTDFRTQRRMRMGGYGDLPVVAEGADYQPLTSPGDEEATYAPSKRGGTEELTFEAIQNDDIGALRRIPRELGRAAARTLYRAVWLTTIRDNATCSYDATPLFHASHSNLGTNALDAAGLLATENAMRAQTFYGTDERMGDVNQPKILVVPASLREIAYKLTQSATAVTTNQDATVPNIFRDVGYRIIVVDDLTDANDWFAFADPADVPILEVGFLNGREEPELFVQDMANVGSVFAADKVTYKIRHIWGIGILDHRGAFKNAVA